MTSQLRPRPREAEDKLDRVFHALADRTRRALLARLAHGPVMVTELAKPFAMSRIAVAKHINVLEAARLVTRTVDGRVHRCALSAAPLNDIREWLAGYRAFWDETLAALARHAERAAKSRRR
jgi:DNA-binding transcriptional ArsR family regulator